jgi:hypothetical protein
MNLWPRRLQRRNGAMLGLGPCLVDEHQPSRINPVLVLAPLLTPSRDGRPVRLRTTFFERLAGRCTL